MHHSSKFVKKNDPTIKRRSSDAWFDISAFIPQPFGTLGDVGRNTLYQPPQRRLDLLLFKDFSERNAWPLEFRVETPNLTNTPSFTNPNATLGNAAFGTIICTLAFSTPHQLQFALRYCFSRLRSF